MSLYSHSLNSNEISFFYTLTKNITLFEWNHTKNKNKIYGVQEAMTLDLNIINLLYLSKDRD